MGGDTRLAKGSAGRRGTKPVAGITTFSEPLTANLPYQVSILPVKFIPSMKTTSFRFPKLASPLWLTVGVGCTLALSPLVAFAQTSDPATEKASQSQPTDPIESKTGELNQAEPGGPAKIAAQDALFVIMFGSGNVFEIRLSELALKNSENPDVKAYAQMMITDHSKANDQLLAVAKDHNIDFPPAPPAAAYKLSQTMLSMKGAEFDKVYMGELVKAHTNDLAAYKKAKGEVKDHLLTEYVDGTEKTVAEHLKKAKEIDEKLTTK